MLASTVAAALERLGLRGRGVLVAVSGGLDSVALAHLLRELAEDFDLKLLIGHVNHGLRGPDADADQTFVEGLARGLGLPFACERVAPDALRRGGPSRDRPTRQEAARALRYAALARMADAAGAARVATAHTADDQAETVLLRLLRGCGPDGLAGIPERSPDGGVARPLLGVPRAALARFAAERGLAWREDASNASPRYARNRLRREWLPGLAQAFNPRLLNALAGLAEAQRRDSEWIAAEVAREAAARFSVEEGWLRIDATGWRDLPESLSRRLSRLALARAGTARLVTRTHLARMDAFLRAGRPGRTLELPGPLRLRRDRHGARLGPLREGACAEPVARMLSSDGSVGFPPRGTS